MSDDNPDAKPFVPPVAFYVNEKFDALVNQMRDELFHYVTTKYAPELHVVNLLHLTIQVEKNITDAVLKELHNQLSEDLK